jgi:hypothetical protein
LIGCGCVSETNYLDAIFIFKGAGPMSLRTALPVAAVGLALIASCQSADHADQGSSPSVIRPASVTEAGPCDALVQEVQDRTPTALGMRMRDVRDDLRQAQELCNSGRPKEGRAMLHNILDYMNRNPGSG